MRIPIRLQLGLLVLLCALLALMVLALATWFQNYNFITDIRLSGLSLTASLKAAQISAFLILYRSSVQSVATRVLIQSALTRYNNGNTSATARDIITIRADLQGALSGGGSTALLLQAVLLPNSPDPTNNTALVNVTADSIGSIELPYKRSDGTPYLMGDAGLGYPPPLYPNFGHIINEQSKINNTTVTYDGKLLNQNSVIFIGPFVVNETFSLFSMTVPIVNNTSVGEILGWLTVVIDIQFIYDIVGSPEGLGQTGQVLLIGPADVDNRFPEPIRGASRQTAAKQEVHFVLPPINNSSLGYRHLRQFSNTSFLNSKFLMSKYKAVVDAWTLYNRAVNNAGALISTRNEENYEVSVGYATLSSRLVDWVVVVEQSHGEVVAPIKHLRDVVLICVFSVTALLLVVMLPLAHFSVAPIRALRAATQRSVQPILPEGSSAYSESSRSGSDVDGDEADLTAQEAKKEGFAGFVSNIGRKRHPKNLPNSDSLRRRTFRIPGKVPQRKHWIKDELTDLTTTFNAMSEELTMQYERLEERVRERTAELETSKKAAEVANESKTLFIANISHELKTPLNGILGLCAVCMGEDDIQRIRSTLGTIYKSGDLLLHLLTDLLTFSKNSVGQQLAIDETEFRLSDLSTQLVPTFEKQAREGQIDLEVIFEGTTDAFGNTAVDPAEKLYGPSGTGRIRDMCLWGDKNRILQVLMNFTSNSLKFTPPNGKVTVRIRCVGLHEKFPSRMGSTRKTSFNSKKSKTSKSSSKRKARGSDSSLAAPNTSGTHPARPEKLQSNSNSHSGEDSKLSINVGGGTTQIAKVAERRRSMSPPPLNTKDLLFEFEVEDTGPGIPDDQQQKIFEPFVQGDLGLSKKYGGTGLGLSICAQLAALMGGNISLSSRVGVGSTFMMQLPLRFITERTPSMASSNVRQGSRASSIVGQPLHDDARILGRNDSDVTLPDQVSQSDESPSAKLADVPRIVGFSQPYVAKESKSESPKAKINEMKRAESVAAKTGQKVRVLVAEDNKVNQEVVLRMLKLEDVYDVTIAKDGQEAFDKVRASMESGDKFDLIFMDVQMPNLDGIQSTKLIREMGFSAPIVALTAFAEKSNEDECMASGMDYFLPKPIRRPALKQVLKKYCATIPEEDVDGSSARVPTVQKKQPIQHTPPLNRGSPRMQPRRESPRRRPDLVGLSYDSNDISPLS